MQNTERSYREEYKLWRYRVDVVEPSTGRIATSGRAKNRPEAFMKAYSVMDRYPFCYWYGARITDTITGSVEIAHPLG